MKAWPWIGAGAGVLVLGYVATRHYLPSIPPTLLVQPRPFAPGWYDDESQRAAVLEIARDQLGQLDPAYVCSDAASCGAAVRAFARAEGLADPTAPAQLNEAGAQAFAYAVDDKYRAAHGLAAASTGLARSGGLLSPARHRRWT